MSSRSGNSRARSILEKFIRQPIQPHDHDSSDKGCLSVLDSSDVSEAEQSLESLVSDSVINSEKNSTTDCTPDRPDPLVNGKFYYYYYILLVFTIYYLFM